MSGMLSAIPKTPLHDLDPSFEIGTTCQLVLTIEKKSGFFFGLYFSGGDFAAGTVDSSPCCTRPQGVQRKRTHRLISCSGNPYLKR
jgi:hypothetical protein